MNSSDKTWFIYFISNLYDLFHLILYIWIVPHILIVEFSHCVIVVYRQLNLCAFVDGCSFSFAWDFDCIDKKTVWFFFWAKAVCFYLALYIDVFYIKEIKQFVAK